MLNNCFYFSEWLSNRWVSFRTSSSSWRSPFVVSLFNNG